MPKLKVRPDKALVLLQSIPHKRFQNALNLHWLVDDKGNVQAQSLCWLYCWGKSGMGSQDAMMKARHVFDTILDLPFQVFDSSVNHTWAKKARYSKGNINSELEMRLG